MDIRDMRLVIAAHHEAGAPKIAQDISELGVAEVFAGIPASQRIDLRESYNSIASCGGELLIPEDPNWPIALNDLAVPPVALIVKGEVSALNEPSLAIVGTRNPTPYGIRNAQEFAAGFVDRGWAIGLDSSYPAGNQRLFDEIAENGAIVTEYLPGAIARPHRFLVRNRLIAALSRGTVVVEAAFRSGSLRTARDASDLLRPVMAIPGPISAPTSEGCHRLIGERCAELVTSAADAYEFLHN
jgi:DNA processing protein